jgi:hypothetical protein
VAVQIQQEIQEKPMEVVDNMVVVLLQVQEILVEKVVTVQAINQPLNMEVEVVMQENNMVL